LIFVNKNWPNDPRISSKHICYLFWKLSFLSTFQMTVHFFFKHLCNKKMIYIHMFLKQSYSIGFVIRNESFPHLSSWIYSNYWLCLTKYTTHYLCVYQINFYIVIYMIKNSKIKKLYLLVSKFSFEHAIFSNFPSLFFTAFFLDSYLFFFWTLLHTHLENYIIHTYFNCFIIPTYHIFICRRLFH